MGTENHPEASQPSRTQAAQSFAGPVVLQRVQSFGGAPPGHAVTHATGRREGYLMICFSAQYSGFANPAIVTESVMMYPMMTMRHATEAVPVRITAMK